MTHRLKHPLIGPERLSKLALVYLRQSTMTQVRESWGSTSLQVDQAQLARDYGWDDGLIRVLDDDLGRSGTGTRHRPAWNEMLRLIPTGTVSAVFVLMVSRLSRELRDFAELLVVCKLYDVIVVIDGRPANPRDPDDTMVLQIQAALAQHDNQSRARLLGRARREKAKQGCLVSPFPLGWIETTNGKLDYNPAIAPVIREVMATFWRVRSVLGTVRELRRAGIQLPRRRRRSVVWDQPTNLAVRQFLLNPAYVGDYVFGATEGRPDLGLMKSGYPVRKPVPEERWIRVPNHHPAYLSAEEQARIKEILKANRFEQRQRPRNGQALSQGLLRCKRCGVSLSVGYARSGEPRYQCQKNLTTYARKRCFEFGGHFIDETVERLFLAAVAAPASSALQDEIDRARRSEDTRGTYVERERQRLRYEEQRASDRYHECDPRNRVIAGFLEKEWNDAAAARLTFEHGLAQEVSRQSPPVSDDELQDLQALAANVPAIWRHPAVTHAERKALLRCLIDYVEVDRTYETVEATIYWRSGDVQSFRVWFRAGMHRMIRERHDEGMSVREIVDWLAAGEPISGQKWTLTPASIYKHLKNWGLKPNPPKRGRRK